MRRKKYRKFSHGTRIVTRRYNNLCMHTEVRYRYKVGDCFVSLPQPQVLELLEASTEAIDSEVDALKSKLEGIQEEMGELKKALYARFGRSINLET